MMHSVLHCRAAFKTFTKAQARIADSAVVMPHYGVLRSGFGLHLVSWGLFLGALVSLFIVTSQATSFPVSLETLPRRAPVGRVARISAL